MAATLKERPAHSGLYTFTASAKKGDVAGIATGAGLEVTLELEPAGGSPLCLSATLGNCTLSSTKEICRP